MLVACRFPSPQLFFPDQIDAVRLTAGAGLKVQAAGQGVAQDDGGNGVEQAYRIGQI